MLSKYTIEIEKRVKFNLPTRQNLPTMYELPSEEECGLPDWFAVIGVDRLYQKHSLRLNYVIWQEKVVPSIVIEFLSPRTKNEDLGKSESQGKQPTKWEVYEKILRIPYYIAFDGITWVLLIIDQNNRRLGDRYSTQHRLALLGFTTISPTYSC